MMNPQKPFASHAYGAAARSRQLAWNGCLSPQGLKVPYLKTCQQLQASQDKYHSGCRHEPERDVSARLLLLLHDTLSLTLAT